ncbi:hypothetical protein Hdeb2414_s0016g00498651 [Helianthus debilis subsp. tardiflorus]
MLCCERSARSTFPDVVSFGVAKLNGFRRVFAHVAPIFFERGIAKPETKEISSLSVEPCEGESLVITVFEIKKSEEIYHERYGRFGIDKIWRDDVLPCRVYCRHCVLATKNLMNEAYDNFLDHTYLADRKTTLTK